jgi:hypothetical protein
MKIAYLILAHHQPAMLARLIRSLGSTGAKFFIHLDRRAALRPFIDKTGNPPATVFLQDADRKIVNWGGFSQVAATLNLINAARRDGGFDRFCFLSGADYPIKPLSHIISAFASDDEFIQIQRRLVPQGGMTFEIRANRIFLGDHPFTNPRTGPKLITSILGGIERRLPREFPAGITLYYGLNWWCLTSPAIEAIFRAMQSEPAFTSWCRRTLSSDEIFFQTLIKKTEFASKVLYEYDAKTQQPGEIFNAMHYIDWWNGNPTVPRILEIEDLPALRATGALFARKFDEARSAPLLDAIDAMRR